MKKRRPVFLEAPTRKDWQDLFRGIAAAMAGCVLGLVVFFILQSRPVIDVAKEAGWAVVEFIKRVDQIGR